MFPQIYSFPVTGLALALPSPQKTEVVDQDGTAEAVTNEYITHAGGAAKTAGLKFSTATVTLIGLVLAILNPEEKFGAF
jgi:hypothetical protein